MRPIKAIAVVSKKNPKLSVMEIYSKKDKEDIAIEKDEMIVEVEIKHK